MLTSMLAAVRRNALSSLALTVAVLALAGGAYATSRLSANSVSTRQIVNHSITPAKLSYGQRTFGGYVRDWASVNATGTIAAGSPGAANGGSSLPSYAVYCHSGNKVQRIGSCVPEVTAQGAPTSAGVQAPGAYATAIVAENSVLIRTYSASGVQTPEAFYLTVTC